MNLSGKIALVTGASRGIGRAIAEELILAGAIVAGTATSAEGAQKITENLSAKSAQSRGYELNVNEHEKIDDLLSRIKNDLGEAPSILVNNAAITKDNLLLRMKDEEWDDVISTNLSSIFHLTKVCIRSMMKARWGRIINIGSVVAFSGNPGQVNYCAAKAGVIGFTKAIALEMASRGITANVIAPGFIETEMTQVLAEDWRQQLLQKIPMGRMGMPEDIAKAVKFLASDDAAYITGQTLHVNGGMYL